MQCRQAVQACMNAGTSAVAGRVSGIHAVQEAGAGASSRMAVGLDLTAAGLCRSVCAAFVLNQFYWGMCLLSLGALISPVPAACCVCVQALCRAAGEVVDAMLKAVNKDPEDEPPLDVVAGLYSDKTAGAWRACGWCRGAVRTAGECCIAALYGRCCSRLRRWGCSCARSLLTNFPWCRPAMSCFPWHCPGLVQARTGAWTPTLRVRGSRCSAATSACWPSTPCWPLWAAWRSSWTLRWSREAKFPPHSARDLAQVGGQAGGQHWAGR
jgi:hypothetical protein